MKLNWIIIEGSSEDKYRITKAIERLPESTIKNINRKENEVYLKAMIDKKDDSTIKLQCLEKKVVVNVPEKAEMVKHNLENESGISFFYIKTFYKI
ncbi:MAG: hypothetical protein AABX44_00320, partial [Nanoarchaeota archaeon]